MFAKIDDRIFSSSIIQDPEQTLVFIYLNVLSDAEGAVDMDYESIAAKTRLPVEVIISNIGKLMKPDPKSRSKKCDGARLIPLDPTRPTGWRIVNKTYYRDQGRQKVSRKVYLRKYMQRYMRERRAGVKQQQSNNGAVKHPLDTVKHPLDTVKHPLNTPTNEKSLTVKHLLDSVKQSLDFVKPHKDTDTDTDKDKESLFLKAGQAPVRQEKSNIQIQHTEAKEFFGQLSKDVFGQPLYPNQWPNDMEHWLSETLPLSADDLDLIDFLYRAPLDHAIFTVTHRRQSMRALIENLPSEIQKVKSALRLLEIKKDPAPAALPESDGWGNGYREAALAEFGQDVTLPARFAGLPGDLQRRVMDRRKKMEAAKNGS